MDQARQLDGHREAGSGIRPIVGFFVIAPLVVACVETFLQYSVIAQGDLAVSLAFAMMFTVPGTFFAWLTTSVLGRLPGADKLAVTPLLALGFLVSLLIFRPYNALVYELVSRAMPHMRAMAGAAAPGRIPQSVARFLLINVSGLFVWIALNLFFITRFGFPVYGRASKRSDPVNASDRQAQTGRDLPAFCREAGISDIDDLWAISAEEHYLRLYGAFGRRLIRQSFGAAIAQLPKSLGMQVHRSHWVAFGRASRIDAGKTIQIVLADGMKIPVSSSYQKAVHLTETRLLSG